MPQQLGRAQSPFLLPPEPAGSYQLWQLCAALLVVTSCGFSPGIQRRILLLRARVGHPHLDLNVSGFVAFGILF